MRGGGEQGIDSVAAGTPELEDLARLFVTREFDVWRMWRDGLVERRNWVLKPSARSPSGDSLRQWMPRISAAL